MNTVIHLNHDEIQKLLNGEEIEMPVEQTLRASQNIILKPSPDERWTGGLNGPLDIHAFWERTYAMIDEAMEKRNRSVSVFFHPENGMSVNTYPWPDGEDLWEMYKAGKITFMDFRTKMGLSPMREENFIKSKMGLNIRTDLKGENDNV